MPSGPSWLPSSDAGKLLWLQNAAAKVALYVGTAGIVAADSTNFNGWRDWWQWILNRNDQVKNTREQLVQFKDLMRDGPIGTPMGATPVAPVYPAAPLFVITSGVFDQVVAFAERTKHTVGYTIAMGEDIGIEPVGGPPPLGDPEFDLTALAGSLVRLDWLKGTSDGVIVESQRGDETTWTVLASDHFSPYVDARAPLVAGQPEVRRYRLRYLVGDEPAGNYSGVFSVTTIP